MEKHLFGITSTGEKVTIYKISNSKGISAEILDLGCTVQKLFVKDKNSQSVDVILGYDNLSDYETNDGYLGAAIGRHANRIGKGEFSINNYKYNVALNNGENHLHGGINGFNKFIWNVALYKENKIVFTRLSPDMEENYPGNLNVSITYTISEANEFIIDYNAVSDKDTVCNLTNHCYFNLSGHDTALKQKLQIFSDFYTENSKDCLPTGNILSVKGTPMDFTLPKHISMDINSDYKQIQYFNGYDHNYILNDRSKFKIAAVLESEETGISMTVKTTLPGVQFYSGNVLTERKGKNNSAYKPHYGICLETQLYPNGTQFSHFPSPFLKAGDLYSERTSYCFTCVKNEN